MRLFSGEDKHIKAVAAAARLGYGVPANTVGLPDPFASGEDPRLLAKTFIALLKAFCPAQWY